MDPISSVRKSFELASVGVAGATGLWLDSVLQDLQVPDWRYWLLAAVIVVAKNLVYNLLTWMFDVWPMIRRLLLPNKFIEGTWIELAISGVSLLYISIVTIEIQHGKPSISADCFDAETFLYDSSLRSDSSLCSLMWPSLNYVYEEKMLSGKDRPAGITWSDFTPRLFGPTEYSGTCFDNSGLGALGLKGFKLRSQSLQLALKDPLSKRELLNEWKRRWDESHVCLAEIESTPEGVTPTTTM